MSVFERTPPEVHPPFQPGHEPDEPRGSFGPIPLLLPKPWRDRIRAFDDAVDHTLDRFRGHPTTDKTMYALSELADFALVWHLIGASRALRSDRHLKEAVRLSALLGLESVLVNGLVKSLFRRVRPLRDTPHPFPLRRPLSSSFPSGHASSGFTAASLLGEASRAAPLYYGLASAIALSRVYVKIHHASDVVGGVATGLVLGRLARRLWTRPPE
ncbi:MAG: phosphatase PAP2 family protein [Acidimicrobiales bacterium]